MKITKVDFDASPRTGITQGQPVTLKAQLITDEGPLPVHQLKNYTFKWSSVPDTDINPDSLESSSAEWVPMSTGEYEIHVTVEPKLGGPAIEGGFVQGKHDFFVEAAKDSVTVTLAPAGSARTNHDAFYQGIRESRALEFRRFQKFVDLVMCGGVRALEERQRSTFNDVNRRRATVFPGMDAYQRLKVATEVYLMLSVRVLREYPFDEFDSGIHKSKHGYSLTLKELQSQWDTFLKSENGVLPTLLPIDDLIRIKLKEPIIAERNGDVTACVGLLQEKLRRPCFIELIWSYWHEEGMLVQTMKAIALRFQNHRAAERDPLASFDVSPLHPLSNLLWGYIQDEQHRLTVPRRAYEYDHHYGIALDGKAVPRLRSADSRSKFIEAFHNLLHGALMFYKQADDTTIRADGFPVLNALKEVHLLLREGMHNQFGDLPSTARQEMWMEQWLLARPEMREFLGGRAMMPYNEDWMDRVDTMKKLQGWTDVSVTYFNELARFGELLLLTIRHGDWSNIENATFASHWAHEWRPEIQQYVHAYRTVTGVDLSPERSDVRLAADRYVQPSVHLRRRLDAQKQQPAANSAGFGSPRRADAAAVGRNGSRAATGRRSSVSKELELTEEIE